MPGPELCRTLVAIQDAALFRIEVHSLSGPVGDIGEVAPRRAVLGVGNFRVERLVTPDGFNEVAKMRDIAARTALLPDLLALWVVDGVAVAPGESEGTTCSVERDKWIVFPSPSMATAPAPDGRTIAEVEDSLARVWGFLVVIVVV